VNTEDFASLIATALVLFALISLPILVVERVIR